MPLRLACGVLAGNSPVPCSLPRAMTPADPPETDPADRTPRERELERRSAAPAITPWLVIAAVLLLGAAVYAASAYLS